MIVQRTKGISKFTSRLEYQEIQLVRTKFKEWIETFNPKVVTNHIDSLKNSRLRIYHSFECLLASGMRIGELAGLNFQTHKVIRVIQSEVCQKSIVEIIINTEKTCKKREV
jgi:site-specific recombinase XerD